jgi:hypothetical protein
MPDGHRLGWRSTDGAASPAGTGRRLRSCRPVAVALVSSRSTGCRRPDGQHPAWALLAPLMHHGVDMEEVLDAFAVGSDLGRGRAAGRRGIQVPGQQGRTACHRAANAVTTYSVGVLKSRPAAYVRSPRPVSPDRARAGRSDAISQLSTCLRQCGPGVGSEQRLRPRQCGPDARTTCPIFEVRTCYRGS